MSGHGVGVSLNEFFCLCKIIFNKHVTFVKKAPFFYCLNRHCVQPKYAQEMQKK